MSRKVDMNSSLFKKYTPKKVSPEKAAEQAAAIAYEGQRKSAKILTTSRKKARLKALK